MIWRFQTHSDYIISLFTVSLVLLKSVEFKVEFFMCLFHAVTQTDVLVRHLCKHMSGSMINYEHISM